MDFAKIYKLVKELKTELDKPVDPSAFGDSFLRSREVLRFALSAFIKFF